MVYTGWCALPAPIVAETVAREGFCAVTFDGQHGLWDLAAVSRHRCLDGMAGAAPIVRVPLGDFAIVSRALDFGAEGIIAPMINTVADARLRGGREISAARRAQLGAAARHGARKARPWDDYLRRGQ